MRRSAALWQTHEWRWRYRPTMTLEEALSPAHVLESSRRLLWVAGPLPSWGRVFVCLCTIF